MPINNALLLQYVASFRIHYPVLAWHQHGHVGVGVVSVLTQRGIIGPHADRPPVGSIPILEEGHSIRACGNCLISAVRVDIAVLCHLG
jgi:hypothetical protein